jgi:predicted  nucleic acid-binding Zn-ribbon protein
MTSLFEAAMMAWEYFENARELEEGELEIKQTLAKAIAEALANPETEIERLKKEVEHLRQAYHRVKDENERLALDLGIKDNPQFGKPF